MIEIEWTEVGRRYSERCAHSGAPEFADYKRNLRAIREAHGFPHWEIKKALTNAEGDIFKALEQLKAADVVRRGQLVRR